MGYMKAIILAAGKGIRMQPLTLNKPKPLVELQKKPLLDHLVSALPETVKEIVLVVGYLGDQIIEYCGNRFFNRPVTYVWQNKQGGTFHALKKCESLLDKNERFLAIYADDLIDQQTIQNCLAHPLAIAVKPVQNPSIFGTAILNSDGTIKSIAEKSQDSPSNLGLTNVNLLNKNIFDYEPPPHPKSGEYYLSVAIDQMAQDHKITAVPANFWFPIATPQDLQQAEKILNN